MSIDSKKASDFTDECAYLNWFFFKTENTITVKKFNGQEVIIGRGTD